MRKTSFNLSALIAAPLTILMGCGGGPDGHSTDDGHDHGSYSADDGHDHGPEESGDHESGEHSHEGETHELGSLTVAGVTLEVSITGIIEPGAELHVGLDPSGDAAPETIRLWIGEESGVGSLKAKANSHGDHFDGHVEVPGEFGPGAKLWLQVESSNGASETKGLDIR